MSAAISPSFADVEAVLKPIVYFLLQDAEHPKQDHLFTFVSHSYDRVAKRVLTGKIRKHATVICSCELTFASYVSSAVQTFTFDIDVGVEDAGGIVEVKIRFIRTGLNFVHNIWNQQKKDIKSSLIEAGKTIVKRSTVHLAVGVQ